MTVIQIQPRDQNVSSGAGGITSEEVGTFDVPAVVNGQLTVTTRTAPDVDRTYVQDGALTVIPGLSVAYSADFVDDAYLIAGAAVTASEAFSFARSGAAYGDDATGTWTSYADGQPRNGDDWLMLEPAATNDIGNPDNTGADATNNWLPADHDIYVGGGLSWDLVSLGTLNGLPSFRFRLYGTASGNDGFAIFFETTTGIAAVQDDDRTVSMIAALVSGQGTGVTGLDVLRLRMDENNSGGSKIADLHFGPDLRGSISTTPQRFSYSQAMSQATCAYERPYIEGSFTSGAAINLYIDIGWRQDEAGVVATSPIKGTRNADAPTLHLPAGATRSIVYTFDDDTTQTVSGVAGGDYEIDPATLDRPRVISIDWRSV